MAQNDPHLLLIEISRLWAAAENDQSFLAEYENAVDRLAALRGGPSVARCQVEALKHRLFPSGMPLDDEQQRDSTLVTAALENLIVT